MVYVKRNDAGAVVAIATEDALRGADGAGWAAARADDPDVLAFRAALAGNADNPLEGSDLALVRVLEDLIELLIDRSLIRFTDLPSAAQAKLLDRRGTRAAMQSLRLLDVDQSDVI